MVFGHTQRMSVPGSLRSRAAPISHNETYLSSGELFKRAEDMAAILWFDRIRGGSAPHDLALNA